MSKVTKLQQLRQSQSFNKKFGIWVRWAIAVVLIIFSIFPVIWMISAALNPVSTLATQKLIPEKAGLSNFQNLIGNPIFPFFTWLWNSIKISTISTILTLTLTYHCHPERAH